MPVGIPCRLKDPHRVMAGRVEKRRQVPEIILKQCVVFKTDIYLTYNIK